MIVSILLILLAGGDNFQRVDLLADIDSKVREQATNELDAQGCRALPALVYGATDEQPERRMRSMSLLAKLEREVEEKVSPKPLDESAFIQDENDGMEGHEPS
jgi:hypothetical protein